METTGSLPLGQPRVINSGRLSTAPWGHPSITQKQPRESTAALTTLTPFTWHVREQNKPLPLTAPDIGP